MPPETSLAGVEQLFGSASKRRYKYVTLPVAGHELRIQSLTEREVSAYQQAAWKKINGQLTQNLARVEDSNRRLIVLCVVDAAGNRLLNDSHVPLLLEWDAADTQHLFRECVAHCGINAGDIEGLEKNSETTHADS
jgi:hypothetical protein